MINTEWILNNISNIVTTAGIILVPLGMFIKIKLDKMTNYNNIYFPTVEKYEKLFKQHNSILNEQVKMKKPNQNRKGF